MDVRRRQQLRTRRSLQAQGARQQGGRRRPQRPHAVLPPLTKTRKRTVAAAAVCPKRLAAVPRAASAGKDIVDTCSDRRMGLLTVTCICDLFGVSVIRDARQC